MNTIPKSSFLVLSIGLLKFGTNFACKSKIIDNYLKNGKYMYKMILGIFILFGFLFLRSPMIELDLAAPVTGIHWAPYSSSVIAAVTDEGKIFVYDLYLRKCRPLCVQDVLSKRRVALTCINFSPFHPVVLTGGER